MFLLVYSHIKLRVAVLKYFRLSLLYLQRELVHELKFSL